MEYVAIGLLAIILVLGFAVFLATIKARELADESRELNHQILTKLAALEKKLAEKDQKPAAG